MFLPGLAVMRRNALDMPTPGNLGAAGWWDPSDLSTVWQDSARTTPVTADGQPVGCVDDKSGNGRNATQATSSRRPLWRTSGGFSWLEFDGVDDALTFSDAGALTQATLAGAFQCTNTGSRVGFFIMNQALYANLSPSEKWGTFNGVVIASSFSVASAPAALVLVSRAANDADLITNGTVETQTTGTSYTGRSPPQVGCFGSNTQPMAGRCYGWTFFSSAVAHGPLTQYYKTKAGIA